MELFAIWKSWSQNHRTCSGGAPWSALLDFVQRTFDVSRKGTSTTCLGNIFQCLATLTVKHFFLTSNQNLLSFSLKCPPLPSLYIPLSKVPFHLSCRFLLGTGSLVYHLLSFKFKLINQRIFKASAFQNSSISTTWTGRVI